MGQAHAQPRMTKLAGVDGCKHGWIVALADAWPCKTPLQIEFCLDFAAVLRTTSQCAAVAVDMPIGLPDGADPRACDFEAQRALGPQRSSIFLAPPRRSLNARDPREFQRMHREIRGVGAGLPVWGIVPKMLEVNLAFEQESALQERVFEFHPELTWRRLAGRQQLSRKKTAAGIIERIAILNRTAGTWTALEILEIPGNPAIDDVLDAISGLAAVHAFLIDPPTDGPRNARGLHMRICP